MSHPMPYEEWLAEVAQILGCAPEEVRDIFYQIRELLYDANASPMEAADFLRANA